MKYRTLGAVMTVVMLLSISAISFYTPENPKQRVHQHLTARGPTRAITAAARSCAPTCPW